MKTQGETVPQLSRGQKRHSQHSRSAAFALPTILISSIIMLTVLLVSVSSASSVRTVIKTQYYEQLSKVAGEAGVAYAQGCLTVSANVPTWTDAKPLKPNTDCTGTETFSCPTTSTNPDCWVTLSDNVRSNFSVGLPPVDVDGRVKSIPNTGYVELLRTSNSTAWRRYDQLSTPTAAGPDLCSNATASSLGWNNAISRTTAEPYGDPALLPISTGTGAVNPGPYWYRKDFNVQTAGTYELDFYGDDIGQLYIDGSYVATNTHPTQINTTISLTAGCHTVVAKVTNGMVYQNGTILMFALKQVGATKAIVVSDRSWRVATGTAKHWSSVGYYADPTYWTPARDIQGSTDTTVFAVPSPTWSTTSGNSTARWISTTHTYTSTANYNSDGFAIFRDSKQITVTAAEVVANGGPIQVRLSYACADSCRVRMDGNEVAVTSIGATVMQTRNISLSEGTHQFGVRISNDTSGTPAGFIFAAVRISDGITLTQSDKSWNAMYTWFTTDPGIYSNDYDYQPNPKLTVVCPCQPITNLATNPSIEVSTANWTTLNATVARSNTFAADGSWSLALTANGGGNDSYAALGGDTGAMRLGMVAGKTYTISAVVNVPTALTGTLQANQRALGIIAYWYTSAYDVAQVTAPNVAGTYLLKMTFTIPAGSTQAFIRLYHGGLSGTVYWDSVILAETTRDMNNTDSFPYRDGASSGWTWSGTSGLSTSTGPRP